MRLTTIFLLAAIMQVSAAGFAQKISLSNRNAPLQTVLKEIREQSGYNFLITGKLLKMARPVSIHADKMELADVLVSIFKDQPLSYTLENKTVVIKVKQKSFFQGLVNRFFQLDIRGVVTDAGGARLSGATITVKGSGKLIRTNANGEFSLNDIDEHTILEVSYIGFQTREIQIRKDATFLTIVMQEATSKLDELTVEAYRQGSQRLSTSNISRITAEELAKQPVLNPLQALEGRIPGMVVNQTTGVPGARVNVQVRGRSNFDRLITGDQPLFIIDGVPMAANNDRVNSAGGPFGSGIGEGLSAFAGLNSADIESISVLKDADATAIYGSRGANGVILITTKKGAVGNLKLDANFYTGVNTVSRLPEMLNTEQYLEMRNEAFANDNLTRTNSNAYDLLLWDQGRYTNFADLLVGNHAETYDAQLTFSGGSKTTQYRIGGGYHKENTVYPGKLYSDRASLNFNSRSTSDNGKLSLDLSGLYSVSRSTLPGFDLANAITLPPNYRLYDDQGNLAWNEGGFNDGRDNPLAQFKQQYRSSMNNLNANLVLNYKVIEHLTLRGSFGYNSTFTNDQRVTPIAAQNPSKPNLSGQSAFGNAVFKNWIAEPQLEYTNTLGGGKLNVLLGATYNSRNNTSVLTTGSGYTNDDLLGSLRGAALVNAANTLIDYNYQAVFGRINYNWQDKYILNLTGRRDGSSKFGPDYRFSNFGAVGAAWVFSNEDLLKGNSVLSYGKLRASYGKTGNDQIAAYAYLDAWTPGATYTDSTTLVPGKLLNPDLHWEGNEKSEIALELGFLKDRILLTAALYSNISSDPLVQYALPRVTGFATINANLNGVKVQNRGLELTLSTRNLNSADFKWSTDFNITVPKNRLKAYPDLETSTYATTYTVGRSLNQVFSAEFTGVDPMTGLYTVKDVNGDGTGGPTDFRALDTTDPSYYGGLNNSLSYKRFNLSFFLQFTRQKGRDWRANNLYNPPGMVYNLPVMALNRWQSEGQHTDVQKFTTSAGSPLGLSGFFPYMFSNGILTDASFIRLKNVSFSYEFPVHWMRALRIKSLRIYAQGQNLFVITGYKGGDPEVQNYTMMSPLRTITGGLQLTL